MDAHWHALLSQITTTHWLIGIGVAVLVIAAWAIGNYNALVRLRQHARESWSSIDTELKRRYDLIPNLVQTVQGYAAHEQQTLERVIAARNQAQASTGSPTSQARDENAFIGALRELFALSEAYPQLKASQHFLALQTELANTEDRIQAARRFYNANVRDLNNRVRMFPSKLIAEAAGFETMEFFSIDDVRTARAPRAAFGSTC